MQNVLMIDVQGLELTAVERQLLAHPNVGAVLIFTRNFKNISQLTALTAEIMALRPDIFIAIDHEGGYVQRLQRAGLRALPAARVYGETYDIDEETGIKLAERFGKIMAQDLLALGIHVSLAPVLDLHGESSVIGQYDRAFHADPKAVVALGGAFIAGMHAVKMPAVAKHFPGHGSCCLDSHIAKPSYALDEASLRKKDLLPFIQLIDRQQLDAIMPAHITYPAVDPDHPTTFSKKWLQDILFDELQFKGLVLSDCLSMAGAELRAHQDKGTKADDLSSAIKGMTQRCQQALEAGCDMVIMANQSREIVQGVLESLDFTRSAASIARLENFRQKMPHLQRATQVNELKPSEPLTFLGKLKKQENSTSTDDPTNKLNQTHSIC